MTPERGDLAIHITGNDTAVPGIDSEPERQDQFDPIGQFPDFYTNDTIAAIGRHRLWTVSDNLKRPVDIVSALDQDEICPRCGMPGCTTVHGAQVHLADEQLLTLDELTQQLPTASNAATHLDWEHDQVMVLDIEPDCPPEVTRQLLRLVTGNSANDTAPALYNEVSMSGRGYHIVLPVPEAMFSLPGVAQRTKLQHPNRWFEVLMYHWITFSRKPIDPVILEQAAADPAGDNITWDALFTQLAQIAPGGRQVGQAMTDIQAGQALDGDLTEREQLLVAGALDRHHRAWNKSLRDDFGGDTSRWEFSILCSLAAHTRTLLQIHAVADTVAAAHAVAAHRAADHTDAPPALGTPAEMDRGQALRIMYTAALQAVPHRSKHDGTRNGLPYLLKQATVALATAVTTFDDTEQPEQTPVRIETPTTVEPGATTT